MSPYQFLLESTRGDTIARYIYFIVRTIQRLFIHDEWSRLTPQEKGAYVSRFFEREESDKLSAIRIRAIKKDVQETKIKKLLETFRNNHTKLMVSRGHVMKLFERVNASKSYCTSNRILTVRRHRIFGSIMGDNRSSQGYTEIQRVWCLV
jgi:hypothetical protein